MCLLEPSEDLQTGQRRTRPRCRSTAFRRPPAAERAPRERSQPRATRPRRRPAGNCSNDCRAKTWGKAARRRRLECLSPLVTPQSIFLRSNLCGTGEKTQAFYLAARRWRNAYRTRPLLHKRGRSGVQSPLGTKQLWSLSIPQKENLTNPSPPGRNDASRVHSSLPPFLLLLVNFYFYLP